MPTYREQVLADGAVAYWRLDESSGNALSQVGNFPGTVSGGVTRSQPGALSDGNTAMAFDGSTGQVVIPNGAYQAVGIGPFTVECWVKTLVLANPDTFVLDNHNGGAARGFDFNVYSDRIIWKVGDGTAVQQAVHFSVVYADGNWHHLVGVFTRGAADHILLYYDGGVKQDVIASSVGGNSTPTLNLKVGSFSGDGGTSTRHFNGFIDEVAIYPTALTPQQIAAHYQARTAWPDTPYAPSVPADVYPAGSLSNRWLPLTPSDVIDAPFGKLWIGGAGNLAAVGADGRIVNFTGIQAGTMLPLAGRRINATNTTATAILALRTQ